MLRRLIIFLLIISEHKSSENESNMLKQLNIRNWALAENLQIEFGPRLNIVTGETGAGKSILVGAIAAVLGERVFTDVIRTGFEKAFVEAIFDISNLTVVKALLEEKGLPVEDDLVIRREISLKSNSRVFVNDSPVTVNTLSEIGKWLMDIHGQHEHQSLLRKETHRQFLDAFGNLSDELKVLREKYENVLAARKALVALEKKQRELDEKKDLYEFQYREIQNAALKPDEEAQLEDEKRILSNVERLSELASQLTALFSGEEYSILEAVGIAEDKLRQLTSFVTEMQNLTEEFQSARIVMEETARSIEEFHNSLEFDPNRLEEVESRLDLIARLKKKYGGSIEDILAYQAELEASINLHQNFQFEIDKLTRAFDEAAEAYSAQAKKVSELRQDAALVMEQKVCELLNHLGMPAMRFKVAFDRIRDESGLYAEAGERFFGDEWGIDQIEFFISPNPGEDYKPLSRIASGGEISRIMLALKTILAETDNVPSLIFDEIDAGISGRIAQSVGRAITNLSRNHQIICITHLPQIAAHGENHYLVEKVVRDERTFTQITPLDNEGKVLAIAKLIAGNVITDTVLESARQLIADGQTNES